MNSNVIYSILGVIFNSIVPILVFPYISRVLGVEALGKYSFYASAQMYLLLITSFGVSIYGVRELAKYKKKLQLKSELYSHLISINFYTAILGSTIVCYFAFLSNYSSDYKIILTFGVTFFSSVIGPDWYFIANEEQRYLLLRNIMFKFIYAVSVFLFIKQSKDLYLYVLITIIGTYGPSILNYFIIRNEITVRIIFDHILFKYFKPLLLVFTLEVLLRFIGLGDVMILGVLKGNEAVGYYAMAFKVIILTISVMNITATALLPRSSHYISNNQFSEFKKMNSNSLLLLFYFGGLFFLLLYFLSDIIIIILGGVQYKLSIEILKILSICVLIVPIINTIVFQILYAKNRIKILIFSYVFIIFFNVILNFLLIPLYSYKGTAYTYLFTYIILFLILMLNRREKLITYFSKEILKIILSIGFIFVFIELINILNYKINFFIKGLGIILSYLYLLYLFKEKNTIYLFEFLKLKILKND